MRQGTPSLSLLDENTIHRILGLLLPENWKQLRLVNRFSRRVVDEHIFALNLNVLPLEDRKPALQHLRIHAHRLATASKSINNSME